MSTRPFLRRLILVLAVLFGLAAALASVVPINRVQLGTRPRHGANPAEIRRADRIHNAAHIALFSALAAAAWFSAGVAAKAKEDAAALKLIALMLILLLGAGTEWVQHLVYRTNLEFNDIFTNFVTTLSTFGILALIEPARKRSELIPSAARDLN